MRNVTLTADEDVLEAARERASRMNSTLNAEFRRWLEEFARGADSRQARVEVYRGLMAELSDVSSGTGRFTRDEMNERR